MARTWLGAASLFVVASCNAINGAGDLEIAPVDALADGGAPPDGATTPPRDASIDTYVAGPFTYHRPITLTPVGTAAGPILVVLPAGFTYAHAKPNGDDLRFATTAARTDDVPYYIETWGPGSESRVWLRPASIPADKTLHMFYGNANAGPASSFATVFPRAQKTAGSLSPTGPIDVDWFELSAGDTLTLPAGNLLTIRAARVIVNGTIDGNGRGYAGGPASADGSGPGGGKAAANGSAGGGAGYGGAGGRGGSDTAGAGGAGGAAYGTDVGDDVAPGSGGAVGGARLGGAGGGGVAIIGWSVSGSGAIHANGADGQSPGGQTGAGGSGGGILLAGSRLELAGATLVANGGAGGVVTNAGNDGGGGGSGGRIKLRHASAFLPPASMSVAAGRGADQAGCTAPGQDGAVGTTNVAQSASLLNGYEATLGPEGP